MSDLIIRPTDPLATASSEQQKRLFTQMAKASAGHSVEEVMGAALNVIVNAIRQTYPSRDKAMLVADEKSAKLKELLAANYTRTGGRLQGAYPFNQTIHADHHIDKDAIRG